jgi:LuxR family quorum sensing-dependent transcriptional regulator
MNTAEDFGMKKGFLVPILRSSGFHACVTMAGERPDHEPRARKAIHLLSLFAHARATLLLNNAAEPAQVYESLTDREKEVLTWIAAGKSSWDIARILNITERTVNWTIGRAMRKLDAVNRTQAVVNAIRTGAIHI